MVWVLRLGHRVGRDVRVTTHVCLAARALGAEGVILSGEKDGGVIEAVEKVVGKWGGRFRVRYSGDWRGVIREWKKGGCVVHLTMYGEPLMKRIGDVRKRQKVLVVVGAGKVPGVVYELSDYNVAVTNQPHSEISGLAVFLHEFFKGTELARRVVGKVRIAPRKRGKCVLSCGK